MFSKHLPHVGALSIAALLVCGGPASAATIFLDDFNRSPSNTVGNGWVETLQHNADDVSIINLGDPHYGVLQLRDYLSSAHDAEVVKYKISTLGYENVTVKFDYKGHNTESPDKFYFEWKPSTSSTWNSGVTLTPNDQNWHTSATIVLGLLAKNTKIDVRFWTDVTDSSYGTEEAFKIDNFKISGYLIVPPPNGPGQVPIPGALPLFVSGIGVIGGIVYRRKRKAQRAAV